MFHLNAGVHFNKVECARVVIIQKFNGARAFITDGPGQFNRRPAEFVSRVIREDGRGGLFPYFLATPLQGAFAFKQVNSALAVAKDLHLDVTGAADIFFDIKAAVTEGRLGLGAGLWRLCLEILQAFNNPDPAPAAAGRSLDHNGKADIRGNLARFIHIVDASGAARRGGHAGSPGRLARRGLVAHGANGVARGPDKYQTGVDHRIGKVRVLGKKAIARMDGIDSLFPGGL